MQVQIISCSIFFGFHHFICEQGESVLALVEKAAKSGVRENQTFHSYAIVPSKDPNLKIAEFEITLSLKRRKL